MSSSATSEQNMADYLLSCGSLEIEGEHPQMEVYFPLLSSALKADISTEAVEPYILVTQSKNYLLQWGLRLWVQIQY